MLRTALITLVLSSIHSAAFGIETAVELLDINRQIVRLDSEDPIERMRAINELVLVGSQAEAATSKLLQVAIADSKEYVQLNAIRALASIGDAAFDAILRKLGEFSMTEVFHHLGEEYSAMLAAFKPAYRKKMAEHLRDENPVVVRACINALVDNWHRELKGWTKTAEFLPQLKALADHKDASVRRAALETIDEIENPRMRCISTYR